ncbi:MAG: addiction module protein [Gemmataceae bacterium]|nr:addiction module protein [Gemmataceae bacterium]
MTQANLLTEALALPESERILLIEQLLESLGSDSDEVEDQEFAAELLRRSNEIDQGTAELIPWSQLKQEKW